MKDTSNSDFSFYDLFTPLTNKKVITFIILIGFAVYFNALFGQFVWDDLNYIINNADITDINLFHLFSKNIYNSGGQYRPYSFH